DTYSDGTWTSQSLCRIRSRLHGMTRRCRRCGRVHWPQNGSLFTWSRRAMHCCRDSCPETSASKTPRASSRKWSEVSINFAGISEAEWEQVVLDDLAEQGWEPRDGKSIAPGSG